MDALSTNDPLKGLGLIIGPKKPLQNIRLWTTSTAPGRGLGLNVFRYTEPTVYIV